MSENESCRLFNHKSLWTRLCSNEKPVRNYWFVFTYNKKCTRLYLNYQGKHFCRIHEQEKLINENCWRYTCTNKLTSEGNLPRKTSSSAHDLHRLLQQRSCRETRVGWTWLPNCPGDLPNVRNLQRRTLKFREYSEMFWIRFFAG